MKMDLRRRFDNNRLVRRSSLIFPVNVPRFVEKAHTREADCCVMDLEDSVPMKEKAVAREAVKEAIPVVGKGGSDVAIRVNKPLNEAKLDLHASIWPGLTCISLPKAESVEEVREIDDTITVLEMKRGMDPGGVQIAAAVESALGVIRAYELARASPRMVSISVGAEDLTREMGIGISDEGEELWYARMKVLMDAYAAGVQPLGIVGVDPFRWDEPERIYEAAVRSRKLGFKGCLAIHPAPIPYINKGFSIPREDIDYALEALRAYEEGVERGTASVEVNGRMVDTATVERCRIILDRARAIEAMEERKSRALQDPDGVEEDMRSRIFKAEGR